MKIESYSFGTITIDGKIFTSDVIIYPDRIDSSWWRKEGHLLQLDDLTDIIREKPDVLIIGTGYSGCMKVNEKTVNELSKRKIEVLIVETKNAICLFNGMPKDKKVIAALHLTC